MDAPDPGPVSSRERSWAVFTHLSAIAGAILFPPFGALVGPWLLWMIKRKESAFIDTHGKAALNFQISTVIYYFGIFLLTFVGVGVFLFPALLAFWLIMTILAAVRANKGQDPGYKFAFRILC